MAKAKFSDVERKKTVLLVTCRDNYNTFKQYPLAFLSLFSNAYPYVFAHCTLDQVEGYIYSENVVVVVLESALNVADGVKPNEHWGLLLELCRFKKIKTIAVSSNPEFYKFVADVLIKRCDDRIIGDIHRFNAELVRHIENIN